jgi:hypothetical protein
MRIPHTYTHTTRTNKQKNTVGRYKVFFAKKYKIKNNWTPLRECSTTNTKKNPIILLFFTFFYCDIQTSKNISDKYIGLYVI